ncbi:MAG: HAMP domain-containing protein, partial [Chloroflexia bacterium]|nr:HAMP domain-containing protein [Chloroflexia bacterium]
ITIQEQGGNLTLYPRDIGDLENDEHFVRLVLPGGRVVADTSDALGGLPLDQGLVEAALAGRTQLTSAVARGETIRLVTAPVMTNGEVTGVLQVGIAREEIDEALWSLLLVLFISAPVVLAVAVASGYTLAGRAMRPVSEITRQAASIQADDLRARLHLDLPDDELGRLAVTFDAMLDRIEEAFEQQRRFTGDAAHELRTPLSLMRGRVDLALLGDLSAGEYRETLDALQVDIARLTDLVSALLALARADAGHLELSLAPVDLADTIEIVGEQFAAQAEEAGVRLERKTEACVVVADEDVLVLVLVNLVANALAHTPPGGSVTLGCRHTGAEVIFWVTDTGAGIAPEHRDRVFDRFYRVGHGPARGSTGAGLGLNISRAIVAAHRGRIDLGSDPGRGTTVTVFLPAIGDSRSQPEGAGRSRAPFLPTNA